MDGSNALPSENIISELDSGFTVNPASFAILNYYTMFFLCKTADRHSAFAYGAFSGDTDNIYKKRGKKQKQ